MLSITENRGLNNFTIHYICESLLTTNIAHMKKKQKIKRLILFATALLAFTASREALRAQNPQPAYEPVYEYKQTATLPGGFAKYEKVLVTDSTKNVPTGAQKMEVRDEVFKTQADLYRKDFTTPSRQTMAVSGETVVVDGLKYTIDSSTHEATVLGFADGADCDSLHIPSQIIVKNTNHKVTAIAYRAFYCNNSIRKVTISDGITDLGEAAFAACHNLQSIRISHTAKILPDDFLYAAGLIEIEIPASVETISWSALSNLPLSKIVFNEGLKEIRMGGLSDLEELTELCLPNSLESVGQHAFSNSKKLKKVSFGKNLSSINADAFLDCDSLKEILVHEDNPYFKADGFFLLSKDGKELRVWLSDDSTLTVMENIEAIGAWACESKSKLTKIVCNKNLSRIDQMAFRDCDSLKTIVLSENLNYLAPDAFKNCNGIEKITIPNSNQSYKMDNNWLMSKDGKTAYNYYVYPSSQVSLPYSTIQVAQGACSYRSDVEELILNDKLEAIGNGAFEDLYNLKKVVVGDSLSYINFYGCRNLKEIIIPDSNPYIKEENLWIYTKNRIADKVCEGYYVTALSNLDYNSSEIVVPDPVERISSYVCPGTPRRIIFNKNTKRIDDYAFSFCDSLSFVQLSDSLEYFGNYVFTYSALSSLVFPDKTESVGSLGYLPKLKELYISKGIRNFASLSVFGDSPDLKLQVDSGNRYFASIDNTFYDKELIRLHSVSQRNEVANIPETVNYIGPSAFYNCNKISHLDLPANLWGIRESVFENANNLTEISIPPTLRYIGGDFLSGSSIRDLYVNSEVPPKIGDSSLNHKEVTIHVPQGMKDRFRSSKGWGDFNNIVDDLPIQPRKIFDFSYCGNDYDIVSYGTVLVGPALQVGILIPQNELQVYKGMKITGVEFDNSKGSKRAFAFVENGLTGERLAYTEQTSESESWNFIKFEEPYVITGEHDLMVGFGSLESGFHCQYSYSTGVSHPNSNWVKKLGDGEEWFKESGIAYRLRCTIEGDHIPRDVRIRNVEVDSISADGIINFRGKLENLGPDPAKEVVLSYHFNPSGDDNHAHGDPVEGTITISDLDLSYGYITDFSASVSLFDSIEAKTLSSNSANSLNQLFGKLDFKLGVETINGLKDENPYNDTENYSVVVVEPSPFERKVVTEATLATWCPHSALGVHALEVLKKDYPDNFIGLTVHFNDEMVPDASYDGFVNRTGSVPGSLVNRINNVYPNADNLRTSLKEALYKAVAKINIEAHFADEDCRELFVNSTSRFGEHAPDNEYRIAYVFTEDSVGPYFQNSGYDLPEAGLGFGGANIMFNNVARSTTGHNGMESTSMTHVVPDTEYEHTVRLALPDNIADKNHLKIVAMLINQQTGEIENADLIAVSPFRVTKVSSIELDRSVVESVEGSEFLLSATVKPLDATDPTITWSSTDEKIASVDSEGNVTVNLPGTCKILATANDGSGVRGECTLSATSSIDRIMASDEPVDVYSVNGIMILHNAIPAELNTLNGGVYIVKTGNGETHRVYIP